MIVEDDQNFHDLYSEILEDTDFRLIHAYDGNEALAKLEDDNKPDLIILDLLLDMMTGDIFLLYLKGMSEYADIPVIVISNFPKRDYRNLMDTEPNLVYLEKPVEKERLIEEIKTKIG